MKYNGNICNGCGQPFTDEDDVVVCPECGTPQHRECYDKENKCVCAHLHGEDYVWQGIVHKEAPLPETKRETVACPNCGYENPKGTPVCKNCGMKFTLFGMNVVDAMHEQENHSHNTNRDIPDYSAPFTLGEGEGFDEGLQPEEKPTAAQVEELLTGVLEGEGQQAAEGDGRINLGGPFPVTDEIDGVMTNTVGNFIGTNAMGYISKFKKMQNGKKLSFNFAAFFLSPYWFFYRKLYKVGIIFMTAFLAFSILAVPSAMEAMEFFEKVTGIVSSSSSEILNDAQIAELTALMDDMYRIMAPTFIFAAINIVLHFVAGFIANPLYKKYVIEHSKKAEILPSKKLAMAYIVKNGGASILIAIAAYFAEQLISMLISNIML